MPAGERRHVGVTMIAVIIFSSLAGLYLVVRRKDMVTIGIGIVLLLGTAALLVDHLELMRE